MLSRYYCIFSEDPIQDTTSVLTLSGGAPPRLTACVRAVGVALMMLGVSLPAAAQTPRPPAEGGFARLLFGPEFGAKAGIKVDPPSLAEAERRA